MRKHIYIWFLSLLATTLRAQQVYDSISYDDVKAILKTYNQESVSENPIHSSPQELFDHTSTNQDDYTDKILNERIKMIRSDVGLTFSATVQENLDDGIEEGSRNFTKTRMTADLDWHLLSGGYYQNRLKARIVDNEARINGLDKAQKNREINYYLHYNLLIYLHNQAKVKLLQNRIDLLEAISSFYHDLHASHLIDRKTIMKISEELEQARQIKKSQEEYNLGVENDILRSDSLSRIDVTHWPVYDVDLEMLLGENGARALAAESLRLQQDNLVLEERTKREWQFKLFARYTVNRSQLDETTRQYPTVGAALQVPIYVGRGHRSQLYEYKAKQLESIHQFEYANLKKELMNHYYEYQYHLKQYSQFLNKKDFYDYSIKLDSTALSYDLHLISPLQLLDHTLAGSAVELELLDLRQQLYLKLLKMYTLSGVSSLADFVKPVRRYQQQASLVLVIDARPKSSDFLEAYVNLHNIEKLLVKQPYVDQTEIWTNKMERFDPELLVQVDKSPTMAYLEVSNFSSKSDLDKKIQELSQTGVREIILDNWAHLVSLEMSTLND